MIVTVWNEELGINIVIEDITIERGEPNLIQIDVPIPVNADIGQYSLMIELYPENYGYNYADRVTDSINVVVGNAYSPDDIEVVFLSTPGNNEVEGQNSVSAWMFISGIALLGLIVFFIFKITALLRA